MARHLMPLGRECTTGHFMTLAISIFNDNYVAFCFAIIEKNLFFQVLFCGHTHKFFLLSNVWISIGRQPCAAQKSSAYHRFIGDLRRIAHG